MEPNCTKHAEAIAALQTTDAHMAKALEGVTDELKSVSRNIVDLREEVRTLPQRMDTRYVKRDETDARYAASNDVKILSEKVEASSRWIYGCTVIGGAFVFFLEFGEKILKFFGK